ncbi:receptor-like cytoplasmic kinase 176 [Tanacetum coccineum]
MATMNFRSDSVLGEGGFRPISKGWIDEQSLKAAKRGTGTVIAVKRSKKEVVNHQVSQAKINDLGLLDHLNLVKLIGYILEDDHMMLVYEFMP